MANRRNKNIVNNISPPEKEEELSVQEVYDVLEFAKASINQYYPGIITPDLINSQMRNKNYNPETATELNVEAALADPKNNEIQLRQFVENLEIVSSPFKRVLAYMNSHLAFDYTYTSTASEDSDFKSPAYKKDEKIFLDFVDRFDYKEQFGNVVKQMLRNETVIVSPRFDGEKIVLQELPLTYMRLTGMWDYGYLASIRLEYFLQPGVDLRLFPKFFTEEFNKVFGESAKDGYVAYDPSISLADRGNSRFATWVDIPPDYGYVFKFDQSIATMIPYYASLMPEFVNAPLIRSLQKNMYIAAASKMILGGVPMIKDAKAKVSDSIMISPDALGKFLSLVKSAVGDAIKVAAAPLENMNQISFNSDNDMYSSYVTGATNSSGVNAPLINSGKLKANAIESQLSFQSDSLMMEKLYPQFNNFINYFGNKLTKKYKFCINFEGNSYFLDRKARLDTSMTLADRGIVLPQKIAAAIGMKPQDFIKQMRQSKAMGFIDMLTPIIMASQMPGEISGGRPQKSSGDLSDSGSATRENASNLGRGGKV